MAVASYFDSVPDGNVVPFPKPAPDISSREMQELLELEFSDIGRDPHFLPGWYILPSILGGLLVLVSLFIRFV
jgi:hypothetical protein